MKFYLCQTPHGPQYVHLQADAKRIDPNFETVEIDLSKGAIMDRLNDLMRRAHVAERGEEPAVVSRPAPPKGSIGTFSEGNEPPPSRFVGESHLVREGRACNVCLTKDKIEKWRASSEVSIELGDLIVHLTEKTHLDRISELIEMRKADLG